MFQMDVLGLESFVLHLTSVRCKFFVFCFVLFFLVCLFVGFVPTGDFSRDGVID